MKKSSKIKIGKKWIGFKAPVYIIAEAGVNHNGNLETAKKLVSAAKSCGADCVKFQTFKAERVVTPAAPKARYQAAITGAQESQLEMLKKLELDPPAFREIADFCKKSDIEFLSTPYNLEDIDTLESIGVNAYKIASGQIVEPLFLKAVAAKGKPILISTGMATLSEVEAALTAIREMKNDWIALLQCTTDYPSRPEDANLRAIKTMGDAFGTIVGYSDHTSDNTACLVALGLDARVIEKHITLSKSMPGPDHKSSADPGEFRRLVDQIREAEKTLGTGIKQPSEAEKINAVQMRRSIVARRTILKGTVIGSEMLTFKRPSSGIEPARFDQVVGKVAGRDIAQDEVILWEDLVESI